MLLIESGVKVVLAEMLRVLDINNDQRFCARAMLARARSIARSRSLWIAKVARRSINPRRLDLHL